MNYIGILSIRYNGHGNDCDWRELQHLFDRTKVFKTDTTSFTFDILNRLITSGHYHGFDWTIESNDDYHGLIHLKELNTHEILYTLTYEIRYPKLCEIRNGEINTPCSD